MASIVKILVFWSPKNRKKVWHTMKDLKNTGSYVSFHHLSSITRLEKVAKQYGGPCIKKIRGDNRNSERQTINQWEESFNNYINNLSWVFLGL